MKLALKHPQASGDQPCLKAAFKLIEASGKQAPKASKKEKGKKEKEKNTHTHQKKKKRVKKG